MEHQFQLYWSYLVFCRVKGHKMWLLNLTLSSHAFDQGCLFCVSGWCYCCRMPPINLKAIKFDSSISLICYKIIVKWNQVKLSDIVKRIKCNTAIHYELIVKWNCYHCVLSYRLIKTVSFNFEILTSQPSNLVQKSIVISPILQG